MHNRNNVLRLVLLLRVAMSSIAKADALNVEEGYSLYDVLEDNLDDPLQGEQGSVEYHGMFISSHGNGTYHVQLEGHAGEVMMFSPDDYDDVLELISDLNEKLIRWNDFEFRDDREGLVEWAGKIMTNNEEKAEENPGIYLDIPDDVPEPEL